MKLFTKLMSSFSLWYKYLHWDFVHVQIKCNQTSLATSARNLDTDFVNTILTEKKKMISSLARLYNTWNLALTTFWYEIWTRHYSDMVTSFLELSSTPSVFVHSVYSCTPSVHWYTLENCIVRKLSTLRASLACGNRSWQCCLTGSITLFIALTSVQNFLLQDKKQNFGF